MDGREDPSTTAGSPRARHLGYPDSTLDVVVRRDRAELLPDRTRPIGNTAWLTIDRRHLVTDLASVR
jgi:hypothetical protein